MEEEDHRVGHGGGGTSAWEVGGAWRKRVSVTFALQASGM